MCTAALDAGLSTTHAMAIGDAFSRSELDPYEWAHCAHRCGLPFPLVATELAGLARRVLEAFDGVARDAERAGVAREVTDRIREAVVPECERQQGFAAQVRRFKAKDFS